MIFGGSLKLQVSAKTAAKLSHGGKLKNLRYEALSRTRITDAYFDTPRCSFFTAGTTFRIRNEGVALTQTVRRQQPDGSVKVWSKPLPRHAGRIDLGGGLAAELGLGPKAALPTRQIFSANLNRRSFKVGKKRATVQLTTTTGEIRSAGPVFTYVAEPVFDLELSSGKGNRQALFDVALEFVEQHKATLQPDTIASRGFALSSRSLQKRHAKARKVKLDPDVTVGEAFEAIIESAIWHLMSNQTAALRGDPNGIHQTRVAIRRLRAALRAFKAVLPYKGRKAFSGELRWFQQHTGPARDWHVFAEETLPRLKPSDVAPAEMAILRKVAAQEGRLHSAEAAQLLQGKRYTRMVLHLGRWIAELFEDNRCDILQGPMRPFARRTLAKAHRDLLTAHHQARRGVMEDMHKVRIRGKKVRYAAEFFAALFDGDEAQTYVKMVEDLQDRLGAANDARVACVLVAELDYDRLGPSTIDGVRSWSSRRVSRCLEQARPTLQLLQSADVFWDKR